jgi:ribose transport system substrate-binding protein
MKCGRWPHENEKSKGGLGMMFGGKRLRTLSALAALMLGTAHSFAQEPKPEPPEGYTLGFVTAAVGLSFYQSMKCGADEAAKELKVNLLWQGSQSISARDELQVLQAVAAQKPDGILLVPWDSTAFVAPTKQLMESGTPVITVDGSLVEAVDVQNIRTNNRDAGIQAAKDLAEMIGGKGKVLILTAAPGNAVQNERWQGFKEILDTDFKDIKVLDVQYVGSDAGKAASVTSSTIVAHSDLAAIYTTQGTGAEGAANALRAAGKTGQIKVVGYDASLKEVELLKAGELDALVSQTPYELGVRMVESMVKYLKEGKNANLPYQEYTPSKFLTRENVDDPENRKFIYLPDCN